MHVSSGRLHVVSKPCGHERTTVKFIYDRPGIGRSQGEHDMSMTDTNTVNNGVNVAALLGAREAMTGAPAAAQFTVAGHQRLGQRHPQPHDRRRLLRCRRPAVAPHDLHARHRSPGDLRLRGPRRTPVEMVLAGLAGCLTAGVAAVAQNRGVQLRSVTATLSGDMDLAGILGIDPDVRNGFNGIT